MRSCGRRGHKCFFGNAEPHSLGAKMIRAYSYRRFSTPSQRAGDSARRQDDVAVRMCADEGWHLDDLLVFEDDGVSAFRGKNAAEGDLARFFECIKSGRVRA